MLRSTYLHVVTSRRHTQLAIDFLGVTFVYRVISLRLKKNYYHRSYFIILSQNLRIISMLNIFNHIVINISWSFNSESEIYVVP